MSGPVDLAQVWANGPSGLLAAVDVPALTAAQLPVGATVTYSLVASNNSSLASPTSTVALGTQTGAGGTGATAGTFAARANALTGGRYLGLLVAASATAAVAGTPVTLYFATH